MKKIWPLLLLLLLLIFVCTSQKMDKINIPAHHIQKPPTIVSIPLQKPSIEYLIQQHDKAYTLSGNFTNSLQQMELAAVFESCNTQLNQGTTSTNETLMEKGSLTLTKAILPLFIATYKKGEIHFHNEILVIEGIVDNYEDKHRMQRLLAASNIASQDNTKVVLPKRPIDFIITHNHEKTMLSGHFTSAEQAEQLQNSDRPFTKISVSENPKLLDFGGIVLTQKILPLFLEKYNEGTISYKNKLLIIEGKAKSQDALTEMKSLLEENNIPVKNLSVLDKEYLQKMADLKREEEEARLIEENRRLQEEKLRLEQEAAEQARIEEEIKRKAEEAERLRLEEEQRKAEEKAAKEARIEEEKRKAEEAAAAEQARQEEAQRRKEIEKERIAQEKALQLAREAAEKRAEEEKEAKANILKLLQVENIEFNTAKATLTDKGQRTVNKLASILKKYPHIKIEIAGHTDADGSETFNKALSQARVDTVKKELVTQGVNVEHLTAKGYGESKPLVPNTTDENKQKNRRVEINIIGE